MAFPAACLADRKTRIRDQQQSGVGFFDADIALGLGGSVTLSDVAAAVTLATLADAFPLNGIEGDVSLQFEELVIKNGLPVEATGTLDIANLVSRYLSPAPLGDYRAEFQTADDGVLGSLEAISGVLELDGTIRLTADRNYQIVGQVAAKPNAPSSITQQLQFLGTPDSQGMREFRIEGQL